jgi:hypothetical protein
LPVMRRSGVTARLAIRMINDHDHVNRVIVSIGFAPKSPRYAFSVSCPKGIRHAAKRPGLSQESIWKRKRKAKVELRIKSKPERSRDPSRDRRLRSIEKHPGSADF